MMRNRRNIDHVELGLRGCFFSKITKTSGIWGHFFSLYCEMTNISELGGYSLCLEYFQPVLQDQDDSSCREASWVEEEYEVSSVYVKQKSFFTH